MFNSLTQCSQSYNPKRNIAIKEFTLLQQNAENILMLQESYLTKVLKKRTTKHIHLIYLFIIISLPFHYYFITFYYFILLLLFFIIFYSKSSLFTFTFYQRLQIFCDLNKSLKTSTILNNNVIHYIQYFYLFFLKKLQLK